MAAFSQWSTTCLLLWSALLFSYATADHLILPSRKRTGCIRRAGIFASSRSITSVLSISGTAPISIREVKAGYPSCRPAAGRRSNGAPDPDPDLDPSWRLSLTVLASPGRGPKTSTVRADISTEPFPTS
ncbi:hypothetical protein J6590_023692 [Homalodisca vitripennis]|nr:hypothetical protein J6590_023692 [Homalodisca vitripennis]